MKIYSKLILDMETGAVLDAEAEDYFGPVAECKGGGKGSSAVPAPPAAPKAPVTPKSQIDALRALRALRTTTADKRKKAAAAGITTGVLTSPTGLENPAEIQTKKLLG